MLERNKITYYNLTDENGNPTGGRVEGPGLSINWQDGPLGRPPKPATGAFAEDVLESVRQRLDFYQNGGNKKFACRENALALTKIDEALHWLWHRRMNRELRGVQGLNKE